MLVTGARALAFIAFFVFFVRPDLYSPYSPNNHQTLKLYISPG
jgi:hypothetical protein